MMKQKLLLLETKEEDGRKKREFDLERKLQSLHELEVEVVELRRTNKELQHQKRELTIKINAVETEVQHLINRTEVCVCFSIWSLADAAIATFYFECEVHGFSIWCYVWSLVASC
jgi:sugar-specific transcriptional regulator TrmB